MTNQEILQKAIEKAIKNKYIGFIVRTILTTFENNNWNFTDDKYAWYYGIIFSHDFAKAFWGTCYHKWGEPDKYYSIRQCELCGDMQVDGHNEPRELWKEHLQKMVVEVEPLNYLEKFL